MCSLQEHIQRDIRARETAREVEERSARQEVADAFANRDANIRKLVARAAGVDPEIAKELGY